MAGFGANGVGKCVILARQGMTKGEMAIVGDGLQLLAMVGKGEDAVVIMGLLIYWKMWKMGRN